MSMSPSSELLPTPTKKSSTRSSGAPFSMGNVELPSKSYPTDATDWKMFSRSGNVCLTVPSRVTTIRSTDISTPVYDVARSGNGTVMKSNSWATSSCWVSLTLYSNSLFPVLVMCNPPTLTNPFPSSSTGASGVECVHGMMMSKNFSSVDHSGSGTWRRLNVKLGSVKSPWNPNGMSMAVRLVWSTLNSLE